MSKLTPAMVRTLKSADDTGRITFGTWPTLTALANRGLIARHPDAPSAHTGPTSYQITDAGRAASASLADVNAEVPSARLRPLSSAMLAALGGAAAHWQRRVPSSATSGTTAALVQRGYITPGDDHFLTADGLSALLAEVPGAPTGPSRETVNARLARHGDGLAEHLEIRAEQITRHYPNGPSGRATTLLEVPGVWQFTWHCMGGRCAESMPFDHPGEAARAAAAHAADPSACRVARAESRAADRQMHYVRELGDTMTACGRATTLDTLVADRPDKVTCPRCEQLADAAAPLGEDNRLADWERDLLAKSEAPTHRADGTGTRTRCGEPTEGREMVTDTSPTCPGCRAGGAPTGGTVESWDPDAGAFVRADEEKPGRCGADLGRAEPPHTCGRTIGHSGPCALAEQSVPAALPQRTPGGPSVISEAARRYHQGPDAATPEEEQQVDTLAARFRFPSDGATRAALLRFVRAEGEMVQRLGVADDA